MLRIAIRAASLIEARTLTIMRRKLDIKVITNTSSVRMSLHTTSQQHHASSHPLSSIVQLGAAMILEPCIYEYADRAAYPVKPLQSGVALRLYITHYTQSCRGKQRLVIEIQLLLHN